MGFARNEVPYIVFEYLEGALLADEVYRLGGLTPRRALKIAHQVASALEAAHRAGIVHRDLKTDNVFLTDKDDALDHVKVLDFGISRFVEAGKDRGREYVIVDAGMTDFIRPSHYNAHHEIVPLRDGGRPERVVNVVGPICESGDFLALDRKLPRVEPGEYLAVLGTGAYGFVMSSTYNARPRPPEVIVEGERWWVARAREALDDLMRGEVAEPAEWQRA